MQTQTPPLLRLFTLLAMPASFHILSGRRFRYRYAWLDSGIEEEDWSEWEGAELVVHSPAAGELLWLGEPNTFQADIIGTDGTVLDWDALNWTTDLDSEWLAVGTDFEDNTLSAGVHNLKVETTLPTGDHLVWVVGGVKVLHEHAGTYVGNMIVDAISEYDGTEYTASCIGAAILVVDQEGQSATGDSTCLLSILGYDLEANYDFTLDINADELDGTAALDLTFTTTDFEAIGEVESGALTASWNDSLYGTLDISGTLELERISYDIP